MGVPLENAHLQVRIFYAKNAAPLLAHFLVFSAPIIMRYQFKQSL